MIKELERAKGGFSDAIVNTTEWKKYVVKRIKKGIPKRRTNKLVKRR